jgi:hypothetical protein
LETRDARDEQASPMTSTPAKKEMLMFDRSKSKTIQTVTAATPGQVSGSRGLAAMFALDIRAAVLTILVDLMVFGIDTISFETLLPLGILIAAVLAFIVYRIQIEYGDDKQSAMTKCLIIGLLTAIPAPLSPLVAIPGGLFGLVQAIGRK